MTWTDTVVEVSGVRLRLAGHLSRSIIDRIRSGNYEQDEMQGVRAILAPSDVVIEIGAGLVFLSSYCAKIVGSKNTYAFEENPKLEPVIRDTYQLNGVSPHLRMCVLSHQGGVLYLLSRRELPGVIAHLDVPAGNGSEGAGKTSKCRDRAHPTQHAHYRRRRRGIRAIPGD